MNNFCFNQDQGMVHPNIISFKFLVTHRFFFLTFSFPFCYYLLNRDPGLYL